MKFRRNNSFAFCKRAATGNFSNTKICHNPCFIPLYRILKLFLWLALNTLSYSSPGIDSSLEEINGGRATGQCDIGSMLWNGL